MPYKKRKDKNKNARKRYKKNHSKIRAYMAKYYKNNKDKFRVPEFKWRLKKLYGIDFEEYKSLLESQNKLCAICRGNNKGRALHVDHDHTTGKVRGLLCHNCNTGLGQFKDSVILLESATKYLMR